MSFVVIFFFISIIALLFVHGSISRRVEIYSRGAGQPELLMMVWIFLLAGAFAQTARAIGAIDAVVEMTLSVLPPSMLLPGLFLSACIVSFSIGTSVGTIAALVPIAAAMAEPIDTPVALLVGAVVGGSFFGDNLSFISDTTIVATRTQGIPMRDKFLANIRIVLPAALLTMGGYVFMGLAPDSSISSGEFVQGITPSHFLLTLPYLLVIGLALCGANVMVVLLLGNLSAGLIGLAAGALHGGDWSDAVTQGITGMQETILVALMAGGLLAVIRHIGALDYIIGILSRRIRSRRGGEGSIAALVAFTNVMTANNTVAILSVGGVCRRLAQECGVDRRRSASLLDTFSCVVQGLLPYGAQVLIASGLATIPAIEVIPFLYYNFVLGIVGILSILFARGGGDDRQQPH